MLDGIKLKVKFSFETLSENSNFSTYDADAIVDGRLFHTIFV